MVLFPFCVCIFLQKIFPRKICLSSIIRFLKFLNYMCIWLMILSILHYLVHKANSSHKPTFFLEIATLFLSSLLFHVGQTFIKSINFSSLKSPYHRLANRKKLNFATRKGLQNFEGHNHWQCRDITFESFIIFQSGQNSGWGNIGI